jgi:hypothetical protein
MQDKIDFLPSEGKNLKSLQPEQVELFNERGYLSPLDALNPVETEASRSYFDTLLETIHNMHDGRNAYSIMGYHNRCKGIWDLAMHPRILDYIEDLLGPNIVCWSSHYFCKLAQDPKHVPWHQDATYWPVRPTRTITVWLAIDDVDSANAPMRFIPGSHLMGKAEWHVAAGNYVLPQEIPNATDFGEPVANLLQAGQISIHASTVIHGSEPNTSNRRRCGLTFRYIPSSCGVLGNAQRLLKDGIVCRGDHGSWFANSRPANDDPTMIHSHYRDATPEQ